MGKEELRKGMLLSLEGVGWAERKKVESAMRQHLFDSSLWKDAQCIGVTLSGENEWDTQRIIEKAWEENKKVCVPKSIHASRELHFYAMTSFDQIEKGYFDLHEPVTDETERVEKEAIDLMIVPGLLFTQAGYRIGFGGGFYDRFLKDFKQTTLSLLHTNQLVDSFPIESHDVPVDYLITEEGLVEAELMKD